ncbi:MAG TPA: protease pro-enzyme activation domain-containing protein [Terracidiphilus sp.]|jgi:hypothetical protein
MRPLHRLALTLVALIFLSGAFAVAQVRATKPLIVEKVDDNNLVPLRGNTPPAANVANDRGLVNRGMLMSGLVLTLRRSPEQQTAFDAFVASQYDPNSANFHHWLEPQEVGERFGPALEDIGTVSSWLSSHGLAVEPVSKDRMTIRFSGTAAQVEETFHTEIHNLVVKGEPHISNMSDPQIPMALEPVVLGPKALHNFIPRPLHRLGGKVTLDKETGKWQRLATADAKNLSPRPEMGFGCGTGCQLEDVAPYDFAAIYNVLPAWNNSIDGTGQTIAIAGRSDVRAADVSKFRSTFGLSSSAGTFNLIKTSAADPGFCIGTTGNCTLDDQIENALDVEWSGAVAKGATVDLVVTQQTNSNDAIYDSAQYVITNKTAPVLNVSYGLCELAEGTSGNAAYNSLWQSAATEGIAVFVASGDSGSPSCDQGFASQGPYGAQFGLSVSGIASSQYDTAVGGTDLNWGSTASPYWNASNSTTTGATAKGYIPEVPWNDTCTNPIEVAIINQALNTSLTASQICYDIAIGNITSNTNPQGVLDLVNTIGGGGGASNCTTNGTNSATLNPATCAGGYAKPSWQASVTGIPSDNARDIPDVSFFAGNGFFSSAYLICVSDAGTCVSSPTSTTEPIGQEIGGTSVASPAMAGVMALINQKAGSAQGNPNAGLYALAAKQTYSSCSAETVTAGSPSCYFNDPDTGTNAMPCAAGSPNCNVATTGDTIGVLNGFAAGAGFDNATGLGSLNVANVVNGWSATVTGTGTATVAVSANPVAFTSQQGTTVTVGVTGSSGTPTGTVILTSGSFTSAPHTLASDGTTTFSLSPGVLAVGTDTIAANYSGDSVYAAASKTTSVTVTAVSFTLAAASPAAIAAGGTATSNITVASTNGYAGTVTLSCALTSSPSGVVEAPACAPTSGQSAVTLSSTTTTGTGQVTVSTTPAPSGAAKPAAKSRGMAWFRAAGGAALASFLLFFLPGWSRRYRNIFCVLLIIIAGSFLAIGCGGGGGSNGGGGGGKTTPTVTVTPAKTSISETDTLPVTIAVAGSGTSNTPSGSVTMTSGTYSSSATSLASGSATITIPTGKLAVGGTDTLSVSYGGDTNFNAASGTATVTVNKAATTSGTYTFTVTGTGNDNAHTTATTTFTVTVN